MYKGLFLPLLLTTVLHGVAIAVFVIPWSNPVPQIKKAVPQYVQAKLVMLEKPKPKKKTVKPKPKKKPIKTKAPAKPKPDSKKAEQKRKLLEQQKARELEKQRAQEKKKQLEKQREEERRKQEQLQRERELDAALAEEESQRQIESDAELAASYVALITDVIESNWSRPPSARNNMEAELILQLVPTGEVVGVTVVKSSGNTAFDRSAEQAVRRAERFPELKNLPIRVFDNYFRRFRLKFKPEDLRR